MIGIAGTGGEGGIRTPDTLSGMPVFKTGAINHSATSPATYSFTTFITFRRDKRSFSDYFVPLGYTKILLASPVFNRAMALEKSFIGMRSVITGCRSSFPLLSRAVI